MKRLRSTLCLLLAACMVLGMVMVGTAASASYKFETVKPMEDLLGSGYAHVVGQKTVVDFDTIQDGAEIAVKFDFYVDAESYEVFNSANLYFDYDPEILKYKKVEGIGNIDILFTYENGTDVRHTVAAHDPRIHCDANGYNDGIIMTFEIVDAEKFAELSVSEGTLVTVDTTYDLMVIEIGGNVWEALMLDELGLTKGTAAVVTYSAINVTYDANEGTGTVPDPIAVNKGGSHTVLDGITLTKTIDGVDHVLDGWLNDEDGKVYFAGDVIKMSTSDITLTAQYAADKNGDGIADKYQHTITYTLRAIDEANLDFSANTVHGNFYDVVANTSGVVSVEKGKAIGNAFPAVTATSEDWSFIGFFADGAEISDISAYVPTADTNIEIRMMLDTDGDDKDDREDISVVIPGPIITDPTDENPDEEKQIDLKNGDVVIYRGIGGVEISSVTIDHDAIVEGKQTLTNPELGTNAALPEKYQGNHFKAWIFSGPEVVNTVNTYYMDAAYGESIEVEVKDEDGNTVLDGKVPGDATYEVKDEDGNVIDTGDFKDNPEFTLPEVPEKNDKGEIFDKWEVIKEDTDEDGVDDKFTFEPVYVLPEAEDIEIIPDPNPGTEPGTNDGVDALTGEGITILRGAWGEEETATIYFYLRVAGKAADSSDLQNVDFAAAPVYGFEKHTNATFGTLNTEAAAFVGTEEVDGKEYGVFAVTYTTEKAGIIRVTASYGAKDTTVEKGHIVITVGDSDKSARINSNDVAIISRIQNDFIDEPDIGSAGGYSYELMNVDKNKRINSNDAAVIARMNNGIYSSN